LEKKRGKSWSATQLHTPAASYMKYWSVQNPAWSPIATASTVTPAIDWHGIDAARPMTFCLTVLASASRKEGPNSLSALT
jgi:hypothetical protein